MFGGRGGPIFLGILSHFLLKVTNAGTVGESQCRALTASHVMPSRDDKYSRWHSSFLRASSMWLGRLGNIGHWEGVWRCSFVLFCFDYFYFSHFNFSAGRWANTQGVNTLFSSRDPRFAIWRTDPVIRECAGVHGGLVLQIRRGVISQGRNARRTGLYSKLIRDFNQRWMLFRPPS
jgi:hypothetical protein